ncbi:hypothetical protein [Burkholderia sp. BCC1985]|uniref:hypothetical protein n=1 Tax=Burkholderia sp. BCC1985 TaxID=2817442 RepID=UPI002AAF5963|nr:hypothetical protein [Burkholderia sp. BCC1985]
MITDKSRADALTVPAISRDAFYDIVRAALKWYRSDNPSRYLNDEQVDANDAEFVGKLADEHAKILATSPVEQPAATPIATHIVATEWPVKQIGIAHPSDKPTIVTCASTPADERAALIEWAVFRWDAEVKNRPLINVNRRPLDDTWRQVIRHCGGDDVSLLGPRHGDLLAANPIKAADRVASHAIDANDLDFTPDAQHAIADMANIGFALLEQIARMAPGYNWNDSPVEIVSDLINERDEARAASANVTGAEGVDALAHEAWSAAQLAPGEGIEDGARRIAAILSRSPAMSAEAVALPKPVLDALRFYANEHHFHIDRDHQDFDTVSGEPQNWLCSERDDDCTMIEDGSIARAALCGGLLGFEEPEKPLEGEVFTAAPQPAQADAREIAELQAEIERLTAIINAPRAELTDAARDVLAERRRQVEAEGWTPEHDDEHDAGEMAAAASAYALAASDEIYPLSQGDGKYRLKSPNMWMWESKWWKPTTPRRNLVKAGALILAEIERLDRAGGEA